jgi:hypothetical protein
VQRPQRRADGGVLRDPGPDRRPQLVGPQRPQAADEQHVEHPVEHHRGARPLLVELAPDERTAAATEPSTGRTTATSGTWATSASHSEPVKV